MREGIKKTIEKLESMQMDTDEAEAYKQERIGLFRQLDVALENQDYYKVVEIKKKLEDAESRP